MTAAPPPLPADSPPAETVATGDGPPASGELRSQVRRSFGWALLGQLAQRGVTWFSTILLVRILDKEDFGTYSIAVTVAMFLLAFNDLAVGYAITRYQGDDVEDLAGTAATLAFGMSIAIYLLVLVSAPAIVGLFNPPPGSPAVGVVRLAGLAIVIDGTIAASAGLITKALQERIRVQCELGGFVVALSLNFALALGGFGAWSLAAGQVAGSAVTATLLLWRSPIRLRYQWDRSRVPDLVRFGIPLVFAGAFNQLILNTDYVLVNRYLSLAVAGAYFVAFNVSNWPVTLIHFAMRRTAIAGFSRLQGDPTALQRAFVSSVVLLVSTTLPMAALIALQARDVLAFLFGASYGSAATALRFLAGISVIRLVFTLCVDLLTVRGTAVAILWVQGTWWVATALGMWWGVIHHGLVGVGVAQLAAAVLVALPLLSWRLAAAGVRPVAILPRLGRPLLGGLALTAACLAAQLPFTASFSRLAAGGTAGLAAYCLVVLPGTPVAARIRREARNRLGTTHPATG